MVCVDDFALRKRFSYGTVMINLENHRIVDMIPSRDTNDVCNWLKTFHNIEVISRDGAITYASAATNSHPDVIQISDRFHLIKGLSEVVCKYIFREFPARVEIPLTESITDEMKALYNTANRSLRIKFSHEKRRKGLTISDIALLLQQHLLLSVQCYGNVSVPLKIIRVCISAFSGFPDFLSDFCSGKFADTFG